MPRVSTQTKTKASTEAANNKTKEGKAKRAPSVYNLFMQKHLKEWREQNPGRAVKEGMSEVAKMWKVSPENPKSDQAADTKGKENAKKPSSKSAKPVSTAKAVPAAA